MMKCEMMIVKSREPCHADVWMLLNSNTSPSHAVLASTNGEWVSMTHDIMSPCQRVTSSRKLTSICLILHINFQITQQVISKHVIELYLIAMEWLATILPQVLWTVSANG